MIQSYCGGFTLEDATNDGRLLGLFPITEKHYAPWVKSRQISLEQSIEKAWKLSV